MKKRSFNEWLKYLANLFLLQDTVGVGTPERETDNQWDWRGKKYSSKGDMFKTVPLDIRSNPENMYVVGKTTVTNPVILVNDLSSFNVMTDNRGDQQMHLVNFPALPTHVEVRHNRRVWHRLKAVSLITGKIEVGMMLLDKMSDDGLLQELYEIYMPTQLCHEYETEIRNQDINAFAQFVLKNCGFHPQSREYKILANLYPMYSNAWYHVHPGSMPVGRSNTDINTGQKFAFRRNHFTTGVMNAIGDLNIHHFKKWAYIPVPGSQFDIQAVPMSTIPASEWGNVKTAIVQVKDVTATIGWDSCLTMVEPIHPELAKIYGSKFDVSHVDFPCLGESVLFQEDINWARKSIENAILDQNMDQQMHPVEATIPGQKPADVGRIKVKKTDFRDYVVELYLSPEDIEKWRATRQTTDEATASLLPTIIVPPQEGDNGEEEDNTTATTDENKLPQDFPLKKDKSDDEN